MHCWDWPRTIGFPSARGSGLKPPIGAQLPANPRPIEWRSSRWRRSAPHRRSSRFGIESIMTASKQNNAATLDPACGNAPPQFNRRALFVIGGAAVAGTVGYPLLRRMLAKRGTAFVARGQKYDGP